MIRSPLNTSDNSVQFVECMSKKDFISAQLPVIDLYRPLVSSAFHFMVMRFFFPGLGDDKKILFTLDRAMSFVQLGLTVIHFHVGWYSMTNKCWDLVGWWFYAVTTVIVRLVIPVISLTIAVYKNTATESQSNNSAMLATSNALTITISAVQFGFYAKRWLVDTYRWYRERK